MEPKDLEYGNLKKMIEIYESKGRPESPAFLNWFLENVYRLDEVAAAEGQTTAQHCETKNHKSQRRGSSRSPVPPFATLLSPDLDRLLRRATRLAGRLFLQRHHLDAPISAFTRMLEGRLAEKLVAKVAHWGRNVRIRRPSLELHA
jgi:hypothetical protein